MAELLQKLRNLGKLRQLDKLGKVLAATSLKDVIINIQDFYKF